MKNFNKNNRIACESITEVKKTQKHDANLQKSTTIYFQVGLILCLLATYALLEMQFQKNEFVIEYPDPVNEPIEYAMDFTVKEKVIVEKKKKQIRSQVITETIDVRKDDDLTEVVKNLIAEPTPVTDNPAKIEDIVDPAEIPEEIHINAVEFVPIFPGCEKHTTNSDRKKCLNEKVGKIVRKKFNTEIASEYGLSGVQRISVQFKVDKSGQVTDIKTRSPHPSLDAEAKRVINKIPKMEPGKMGIKPVNVIYSLPIAFKVQD